MSDSHITGKTNRCLQLTSTTRDTYHHRTNCSTWSSTSKLCSLYEATLSTKVQRRLAMGGFHKRPGRDRRVIHWHSYRIIRFKSRGKHTCSWWECRMYRVVWWKHKCSDHSEQPANKRAWRGKIDTLTICVVRLRVLVGKGRTYTDIYI